jgi:outer membrane protein assembly factor BamB
MEKTKFKSKISTISLILMLTISALIVAFPAVIAQEPVYNKATHAYIGAVPNPIGINQMLLLHVGITDYLNVVTDGWEDLTVTVTKPDGSTETLGPFRTDATGGTGTIYIPTMTGTYTFQTHFPAQTYEWTVPPLFDPELSGVIMYEASNSETLEVPVTTEQIEYYTPAPLPSEYWTRPIDGQQREWLTISENWLSGAGRGAGLIPNNDYAPDSAHVLWSKALELGGLAGGNTGNHAFDCGDAYEGKFSGSVIIGGILFYNKMFSGLAGGLTSQMVVAVDLHTGEELWTRALTDSEGGIHRLAFGQTYYFDSFNYHAVFDYLWATESFFDFSTFTFVNNWHAFDPFTGEWVYTMENVPSAGEMFGASTQVIGPNGEFLIYSVNLQAGTMSLWNSSRVIFGAGTGFEVGSWRPHGQTWNASQGYQSTLTIPTGLPGGVALTLEDRILGTDVSGWANIGDEPINLWCISTETGQLMWQITWTPPPGDLSIGLGPASLEDGVFTLQAKETRQTWGFNIDTGHEIWGPTDPLPYLGIYGINSQIAYGKLFATATMAGVVTAYDAKTGDFIWTYEATDPYNEILWGNAWPENILFITDGKLYLGHSEHSPIDPKPRGAPFVCLDAETGNVVWEIDGMFRQTDWGGRGIIGDSIIATMDSYDQQIYAIGRGPSKTTVTASPKVTSLGSSVIIEGMITDVSPGTEEAERKLRFPNGVPAVSDEMMSEWMLYVYKQFARPSDVVGVPVTIDAVDPTGKFYNIATVTSDGTGIFSYMWKPPTQGKYTIIATFGGSASYYASFAQTSLGADAAPATVDLAPIQGSVNNVQGSVNSVESSVADLESSMTSSITDVEGSVSSVQGSVNSLESSVSDLESSVGSLETNTSNLTTYLLAILVLVVITMLLAVYILLKTRK